MSCEKTVSPMTVAPCTAAADTQQATHQHEAEPSKPKYVIGGLNDDEPAAATAVAVPAPQQQWPQQPHNNAATMAPQVIGYAPNRPMPTLARWVTGVCGCFEDMSSSAEVCCCWTCQESRQYNMLTNKTPEIDWMICCSLHCIDAFTAGCASISMAAYIRYTIRERYGIPGSVLEDACLAFCLPPCVICQNYREMSARGDWPQGFCVSVPYTNPAIQQPPQTQPPMGFSVAPAPMPGNAPQY